MAMIALLGLLHSNALEAMLEAGNHRALGYNPVDIYMQIDPNFY